MLKINNKVLKINSNWLNGVTSPEPPTPDPYNPLNLPPYTMRVLYTDGFTPEVSTGNYTLTQVSVSPNVWDITKLSSKTHWSTVFWNDIASWNNLLGVYGANLNGVTDMDWLFKGCSNLEYVALFDTSSVTSMESMFQGCSSLTSIPLYDTHNVTDMYMLCYECSSLESIPSFDITNVTTMTYSFYKCTNVKSGALSLYQQAINKSITVTYHEGTFYNCGSNTTSGRAELAQIPNDWK